MAHEVWIFLVWFMGRGIITSRVFVRPRQCPLPSFHVVLFPISGSLLTRVCCSVLYWMLKGTLYRYLVSLSVQVSFLWYPVCEPSLPWTFWTVPYFLLPMPLPGNFLEAVVWGQSQDSPCLFPISDSSLSFTA